MKFQLHTQAAIAGCSWCATIVDGLRSLARKHYSVLSLPDGWEDQALVQLCVFERGSWPLSHVACSPSKGCENWRFAAQFYVDEGAAQPNLELRTRRHLTAIDLPYAPLEFVAGTLQNCARHHQSCKVRIQTTLPKRLIEVTSVPEQDDTVRLIDEAASVLPSESQYAALSYCWGQATDVKSAMLSMTQTTLSEFTEGFPLSKLPSVFHDTVIATRLLKIRYLWIDALCIAQGDPDEWRRESMKMRDVYSSAYVTIVAASSPSCDESFLAMPDRSFIEGIKLGRDPESMNRDVFVRLRTSRPLSGFQISNDLMSCPVDDRGWVLQEILLSRRILEFGHHCLAYSCLESSTCECGECNRSTMKLREVFTSQVKETQPAPVWHGLVQNYTGRQLTVARDKLPAIAGLAAYLKSSGAPDNAYIAGLWKDNFVSDMAWYRCSAPFVKRHASRMRTDGPSWSWVSVDSKVEFWRHGENDMAHTKLVDCKCDYGTGGEFGLPESVVVTLEGPTCPFRLFWDSPHHTVQAVAQGGFSRGLLWNRRHPTVNTIGQGDFFRNFHNSTDRWCLDHPLEVALLPDGTGRTVRPNSEAAAFETHELDALVDLLLLLVEERGQYMRAFFLILAKSDTHEQRYIRIGAFWQVLDYRRQGFMDMRSRYRQRRCDHWFTSLETKQFVLV